MRKTDNLLLEIPRDIRYLRSIKRDEKIEEGYYFGINRHTEHTWSHFDEIKKEVKDFYYPPTPKKHLFLYNFRIKPPKFLPSILGRKLPIHRSTMLIAMDLPS